MEHAKLLERAILQIRDGKSDIAEVFSNLHLSYKRKTYYALKKKYEEQGLGGLIPQKQNCGRKAEKSNPAVRNYIKQLKQNVPGITGGEIQTKIKERYGIDLSCSQISRVSQQLGLETKLGRPGVRRETELQYAGLFILLAAILETGFNEELLAAQKQVTGVSSSKSHQHRNGIQEGKGLFSKNGEGKFRSYPLETATDYEQNGFISNRFKSVTERVKTRDLSRLAIVQANDHTLTQKNLAILSLPIITSHSRVIEINETLGNELKYFAGYDYRGTTLDKYLRELKYLRCSDFLMQRLANFWYRRWEQKTASAVTQLCYYFDGYRKPLWSKYRVRKSKVSKIGRVMGCLEQVYVHSDQGHPILLQTYAGGANLAEAITSLNNQIEQIIPSPCSRIALFDGAANSIDFFETFGEQDYFICLLDTNQYHQDLSDITIKSKVESAEAIYLEGEKRLQNSKTKQWYTARIPLYKKRTSDKYIAFVTNIPHIKMAAQQVIAIYYNRWPNQEHQFRELNMGGDLNTNYGFGKTRVINVVVQHKKKYLEEQIELKQLKIKEIWGKISAIALAIDHQQETLANRKRSNQSAIVTLENKITVGGRPRDVSKILKRLNSIYSQQEKIQTAVLKQEFHGKLRIEQLRNQLNRQEELLKRHQAEYERIKDKEMVYENDVELDQLLGIYKIALANLSAYVLKEYFSDTVLSLEKLFRKVYQRPGKLIIEGQKAQVEIYLNKKDKKTSIKIKNACELINSKAIKDTDNWSLHLIAVYNDN